MVLHTIDRAVCVLPISDSVSIVNGIAIFETELLLNKSLNTSRKTDANRALRGRHCLDFLSVAKRGDFDGCSGCGNCVEPTNVEGQSTFVNMPKGSYARS